MGRCSGLDNFQGPLICIAEHTEKVIDLGIVSPLLRVEENIGRNIQCPDHPIENIITWPFPFVLDPVQIAFGDTRFSAGSSMLIPALSRADLTIWPGDSGLICTLSSPPSIILSFSARLIMV